MNQPSKPLYLPSGASAPPSATLDTPEKLNLIVRSLASARLQRGEPRVEGLFLGVGSLADIVRDDHGLIIELANALNNVIDRCNGLLRANDQLRKDNERIKRRLQMRIVVAADDAIETTESGEDEQRVYSGDSDSRD